MKYALLKCDDVFEILTRAPFPAEDASAADNAVNNNAQTLAVERHLACCYTCRALAEALRPATGLFHESMTEEQRSSLPSYHGPKRPVREVSMARSVRAAMGDCAVAGPPSCHSGVGGSGAGRFGVFSGTEQFLACSGRLKAAFSSGLVLTVLLIFGAIIYNPSNDGGQTAFFSPAHSTASSPLPAANGPAFAGLGAEQYLAALGLPADCRQPPKELAHGTASRASAAPGSHWRCCTECHAAGKRIEAASSARPVKAVAVVRGESCRVCHTPLSKNALQRDFQRFERLLSDAVLHPGSSTLLNTADVAEDLLST